MAAALVAGGLVAVWVAARPRPSQRPRASASLSLQVGTLLLGRKYSLLEYVASTLASTRALALTRAGSAPPRDARAAAAGGRASPTALPCS